MGMQFWWFYDVAAAAVILVAIFISARKPLSKAVASLIAYALGLLVAISASGSLSESFYKNAVKNSNTDKIEKALNDNSITTEVKIYMESLGYNISVKEENLAKIFSEAGLSTVHDDVYSALYEYANNINGRVVDTEEVFREKMTEGFADIISDIVSENLSRYAAETAYDAVIDDSASINAFLVLTQQEYLTDAAEYIEKNYTSAAYMSMIRLIGALILMFVIVIAVKFFAHALLDKGSDFAQLSIAEHICGGIIGLLIGAIIVFIISVAIRIYTMLGSGEMLFFNNEVIDKTLFFRYVYDLVIKL